jgi:hypothetical protein
VHFSAIKSIQLFALYNSAFFFDNQSFRKSQFFYNVNDKLVFCVMQNRFSPPSLWIKSVVDQYLLGEIFSIQINCFWKDLYRPEIFWRSFRTIQSTGQPNENVYLFQRKST